MPKSLKFQYCLLILLVIFSNLTFFLVLNTKFSKNIQSNEYRTIYPKTSWIWASLNLTNEHEINGKHFYAGTTIPIKGKVFNRILNEPKPNMNVSIFAIGKLFPEFSDTTDLNGEFKIDFTIPHTIENNTLIEIWGNVTDTLMEGGEIEYLNHYEILVLNYVSKTPQHGIPGYNILILLGTVIILTLLLTKLDKNANLINKTSI